MTLGELLIQVYGENAQDEFIKEYQNVVKTSNCQNDFQDKTVKETGADFMCWNLEDIISGKEKIRNMRALICKSFGEAMMWSDHVKANK